MQEEGQPVPSSKRIRCTMQLIALAACALGAFVGFIVGRYVFGLQTPPAEYVFVGVSVGLVAVGWVINSPRYAAIDAEQWRTSGIWTDLGRVAAGVFLGSVFAYTYSWIYLDEIHPFWFISLLGFGAVHNACLKQTWEFSFFMAGWAMAEILMLVHKEMELSPSIDRLVTVLTGVCIFGGIGLFGFYYLRRRRAAKQSFDKPEGPSET